ncbi:MAG: chorismate synthase [Phycisphaerales bacterium]|nr:MAG: chorismate synthase [Phycisphaerales bacterium]
MSKLSYRTAGESHGAALIAVVEGLPAGLRVRGDLIDRELQRRQGGYGRSARQQIEQDRVTFLSGLRNMVTIGSPIAMQIANKDHRIDTAPPVPRPRPGHADLAGSLKRLSTDCRETLERASARETAARTAAGALVNSLIGEFGIVCVGFVVRIGQAPANIDESISAAGLASGREANDVFCPDAAAAAAMIEQIRQAEQAGDTVGGIVEVRVFGCPPGLGDCMRWQDKLDGRLMWALGSVQAVKGVEVGMGFGAAEALGSASHDAIGYDAAQGHAPSLGFVRPTNRAGGLEGGMTNGQAVVVRAAMKPISTLLQGADSVNLLTRQPERSDYERSDICAVPALSVICENVVAFEIGRAFLDKFSGDTLGEVRAAYDHYLESARSLGSQG